MKYSIGLDIGIASVGYSVLALQEDDTPYRIIRLGSRVFDKAEQPKTGASLALPRREARGMRRRLRRHRHRNERIRGIIVSSGILTKDELEHLYDKPVSDIYELRTRALDESVSSEEFARILIHLAQRRGFKVFPLVGPSSILMSLMASGFNGQSFAFLGYLPVAAQARQSRLKEMTRRIERERQTQIFIEAPYRNNQLIADLAKYLPAGMRLCVASDITGERQSIITRTMGEWRQAQYDYHKVPTIFLLFQ